MDAIVGQQGPFDRGRQQMKVLAGLEVTAKPVERTAEAVGGDIAAGEQREIRKAVQRKLVFSLRSTESTHPEVREKIRTEADYFERNAERMRYPAFRRQHLFIGSGVIEAGCKTVIGCRLKQSGMFWTVRGANAIIALRCCHLNGRFETYWEGRRAA